VAEATGSASQAHACRRTVELRSLPIFTTIDEYEIETPDENSFSGFITDLICLADV
jgi:hypothetical protein